MISQDFFLPKENAGTHGPMHPGSPKFGPSPLWRLSQRGNRAEGEAHACPKTAKGTRAKFDPNRISRPADYRIRKWLSVGSGPKMATPGHHALPLEIPCQISANKQQEK